MALNYEYNYVFIDPNTNMCMDYQSLQFEPENLNANWIRVPVEDPEYIGKYYINGSWYEDAAGTIPWQSSLI